MSDIDIAFRAGTVALSVFATVVFIRAGRTFAARLGAWLMAAVAVNALEGSTGLALGHPGDLLVSAGSALAVPIFWLFARAWFDDEFELGWAEWVLTLAYCAAGVAQDFYRRQSGGLDWLDLLVYGAGTGLAVHVLWLMWRGRRDDLVESRRRVRSIFAIVVGLLIIWFLWSEALNRAAGPFPELAATNDGVLCATVLLLCSVLFGLRDEEMFARPLALAGQGTPLIEPPPDPVGAIDQALAERLANSMRVKRLYRDPTLTIAQLAAELGVPQHRLRQLINAGLGYRNFNAYLNQQRIEDVCFALRDPAQASVPILTIALDAGFGSLPAFNRAFKIVCGETPSDFRRKAQATD